MLPRAFLDLPRCGTLNVHPSLLPRYRGAAPVQRALQARLRGRRGALRGVRGAARARHALGALASPGPAAAPPPDARARARAAQDGAAETGVSLAFTVLACDAGPVLEQRRAAPGPDEASPELLARLFRLGARMLVAALPEVWAGRAAAAAAPQDEAAATHAPKVRAPRAGSAAASVGRARGRAAQFARAARRVPARAPAGALKSAKPNTLRRAS